MNENYYKTLINNSVRQTAFEELQSIKEGHSKVKNNAYSDMKNPQEHISNKNITHQQVSFMFSLRSHTLRGKRNNFKNIYSDKTLCPICERGKL